MSDHEVKYTLSLRDLLTGKIKQAEHAASGLHKTMHKAKEMAGEMFGMFAGGLAAFKLVEFVEQSKEKFHEFHEAEAQLENTLRNTGERAHMSAEDMIDFAKKTASSIKFSRTEVLNMEGALARFGNMSHETFERSTIASADIATALKRDGTEVARSLGRIMEAPAQNGRLLRQFGISLSTDQQKLIKHLQETGHVAEAQEIIFKKLAEKGYGGAAKAAADADPLFRYNKAMGAIMMRVGEVAIKLQAALAPALEFIAGLFTTVADWVEHNTDLIKTIGKVILFAAYTFGVLFVAAKLYEGILIIQYMWTMRRTIAEVALNAVKVTAAIVTGALTGAMTALNIAMAANPVAFVIIGIAALIAIFVAAYYHFAKFRGVVWGVWETLKEFGRIVVDIFEGVGKVIKGALTFSPKLITEGATQTLSAMANHASRLGTAFKKGFSEGMADFAKGEAADKAKKTNSPKDLIKKGEIGADGAEGKEGATSKATGNKSTTVHVTINGGLIKDFSIRTTNLVESAGKVKEAVTQALLSAVNDSQLIAGE